MCHCHCHCLLHRVSLVLQSGVAWRRPTGVRLCGDSVAILRVGSGGSVPRMVPHVRHITCFGLKLQPETSILSIRHVSLLFMIALCDVCVLVFYRALLAWYWCLIQQHFVDCGATDCGCTGGLLDFAFSWRLPRSLIFCLASCRQILLLVVVLLDHIPPASLFTGYWLHGDVLPKPKFSHTPRANSICCASRSDLESALNSGCCAHASVATCCHSSGGICPAPR